MKISSLISNEDFFVLNKINSIIQQYPDYLTLLINAESESEITLNADGFSRSYKITFSNVEANSRLILQTNQFYVWIDFCR